MSIEQSRRAVEFRGPAPGFRLVLKRNCSISPSGLWRVFALLALVTLGIDAAFAWFGAWLVLPFAGIEVLALGAAFLLIGRSAGDYERIEYAPGKLSVEVEESGRIARYDLDPRTARVRVCRERVLLQHGEAATVEVGRHLDASTRAGVAAELARRLRNR